MMASWKNSRSDRILSANPRLRLPFHRMQIATLVNVLNQPHLAADHLTAWGLRDVEQARTVLLDLAESGLTLDLLADVCEQLADHLPRIPDPDAALAQFGRFCLAVRSPLALAALFERDRLAVPVLLQALSLGPHWSQLLRSDPEAFDLLRESQGELFKRDAIISEVQAEVAAFDDERSIIATLARIRQRHLLRVAYGYTVGAMTLAQSQAQLSDLGDALVAAALAAALERAREVRPISHGLRQPLLVCVVAIGDLGAGQCSLSHDLELLVIYDVPAPDAAALQAVQEHVDRAAKLLVRWLAQAGEGASQVRLLSLPDSPLAASAHAAEDVVIGFDSFGRTWHRQQLLKARPVAGDRDLGERVLARLEAWLFRRYLNRADETGIKALKRRILVSATLRQDDWQSPRWARGGIHDIEATVEWLQLLVGGDQPGARTTGTLAALQGLVESGTLAPDEHAELVASYVHFRKLELAGQILHAASDEPSRDRCHLESMASSLDRPPDATAFWQDLRQRQDRSWFIIRKLLTSAFAEEAPPAREVELLLDPAPLPHEVRAALAPFGFAQPEEALAALNGLASEQVPFLSTRRCRHLLAAILPRLLTAISTTPHPDATLGNLTRVSNSLGGKGVLWDLFRFSPPTLDLYVKLCAASPYLSGILTNNPGMIDELIDSLQLDRLPTRDELAATLGELCRGAADTLPILHDFKNAEHLRIGVRDILGKEEIDRTHAALADVAETCLAHILDRELAWLGGKFGVPTIGLGPFAGNACRVVGIALGKLGGREPNYHSELDLLLLYEAEGTTRGTRPSQRAEQTTNNHFFTQLAQRTSKHASELTPKGRLYSIDIPLRPIGIGGALAMPLDEFGRHFREGAALLWHWQTLCQARPFYGEPPARQAAKHLIEQLLEERTPRNTDFIDLRRARLEQEHSASTENLKRGPGGTLDVEYVVQVLQLQHVGSHRAVRVQNTQHAISALAAARVLDVAAAEQLSQCYRFLRRVEAGLRLLNTSARHDLPQGKPELAQLAYLLGHSSPDSLREQCQGAMATNRALFDRLTSSTR
jgi:[glutamine synthetase] adenylyltransferase / [glutamine synthetase]-adenylyl-L-tyrosine phosphorylase